MTELLIFIGAFVTGILTLIGYGCYRGVNSDGWDDSNMLNWIRLFSHIVMHPEDFSKMYYIDAHLYEFLKGRGWDMDALHAFPYVSKDEFSENFPTSRPSQ